MDFESNENVDTPQDETKSKKRKVNYKKELENSIAENKEIKSQLLRLAAEFDNFRKRMERERDNTIENANYELIFRLLPVLDDFDRTLDVNSKNGNSEALVEGVKLVQKSFLKVLQCQGLKTMESIGKKFNPEFHDALIQVEIKEQEPETVVEEHIKGYLYKDRVIRPAKVIVSK